MRRRHKGGLSADTVHACRAAAIAGAGIALLPDFTVSATLRMAA